MPPPSDWLSVQGLGLRLSGVTGPADLVRLVSGTVAAPSTTRRFEAPYTDLEPVDRWTSGPVEPRMPAGVAVRGLRALPAESRLALAAAVSADGAPGPAAAAVAPLGPGDGEPVAGVDPGRVAVLWASSTAGLAEYATICVEAAVLDPGLSSPIIGPASAFNSPAATVSIRLGLDGPNETVTGGTTAGLAALVEAGRFVADGEAARALVGGSATVSRWSLAGLAEEFVAAEGAGCLAVRPWHNDPGVRLGRFRRVGLDPSLLVAQGRTLLSEVCSATSTPAISTTAAGDSATSGMTVIGGAAGRTPVEPGPTIVSALDTDLVGALAADHPRPVWHLERSLGDFGAAGGFMAVAGAVAYCANAPAPTSVLVLAIEPSGNAAILEVSSWAAPTSSSGW